MEPVFPLAAFLQVKQQVISDRNSLEHEKAVWAAARKPLNEAHLRSLDERFKATFEKLGTLFSDTASADLRPMLQSLQDLVQQGASARLLGNDELGSYNLAMFIQYMTTITGKERLEAAAKITRLTIVAGADINSQKAYAGNGGAICLEWLCLNLAGGISDDSYLRNMDQYECFYKMLPWIIEKEDPANANKRLNPFIIFMSCLKDSPAVAHLQENVMLMMIYFGYAPFASDAPYQPILSFSRIAAINARWLTILFPFEEDYLQHYLHSLQMNLNKEIIHDLLNGFTSNNKARKQFRTFFSSGPHWLLKNIITSSPDTIFRLVKRNEQDLLIPFLKNFKSAMSALRDENGNTLLYQAMQGKSLSGNTLRLLRTRLEQ